MCGFEAELTAAGGGGLSIGAGVFYRSNVDPVGLRNAHATRMTLINSCRGMALEIVQRSKSLNDAWQNLKPHYRAKGAREVLRLSHKMNGKMRQPGEDPSQFMMKIAY